MVRAWLGATGILKGFFTSGVKICLFTFVRKALRKRKKKSVTSAQSGAECAGMRLHVTVGEEIGEAVIAVSASERRSVSSAAAVLIEEAVMARKKKATRAEVRAVKLLPALAPVGQNSTP